MWPQLLLVYLSRSICKKKKNICLYPETAPRNKPKFIEESLGGDKLVKNLEKFWMTNKTIIEFGFRMTWRIMQISEDVRLSALVDSILRDLHSFPHPTQPHSIIAYFMYTYDTVQDFLVRNDTLIWLLFFAKYDPFVWFLGLQQDAKCLLKQKLKTDKKFHILSWLCSGKRKLRAILFPF